eukprot:gene619-1195_t
MAFGAFLFVFVLYGNSYSINRPLVRPNKRDIFELNAKAKPGPAKLSKNAEYYIMMKQFKKLKDEGASYESIKKNIANTSESGGYQRFVGKGNLDQRLRAVINYKRDVTSERMSGNGITPMESEELDALDEYDEEFDDDEELVDDEERLYESMVLDIIQKNKISQIQREFMFDNKNIVDTTDKEEVTNISQNNSISNNINENSTTNSKIIDESEMYTPKSSAWGVFQRPKDISKTYGGGRVITREEIIAMDIAFEEQKATQQKAEVYISDSMKVEKQNIVKINDALAKGRARLHFGDRAGAVSILESMQDFVSWHSEFGGDYLLELAMALETVQRSDDARSVYGRLATTSWSQKIRRQALQLMQGLDITQKLRQDGVTTQAPVMDLVYMTQISEKLKEGLTNEWDDYKKKDKKKVAAWFEDDEKVGARLEKVTNIRDAYYLLLRAMNPLKKVPSEALSRALRMMYITPMSDKLKFITDRMAADAPKPPPSYKYESTVGEDGSIYAERQTKQKAPPRVEVVDLGALFGKNINGSWDLVMSLSDKRPHCARMFESGSLRRTFDTNFASLPSPSGIDGTTTTTMMPFGSSFSISDARKEMSPVVTETEPVFWGLGSNTRKGAVSWNSDRSELTVSLKDGKQSPVPCQKPADRQIVQILWADEEIKVTRQSSETFGNPDLYTVWRRLKPVLYKKY